MALPFLRSRLALASCLAAMLGSSHVLCAAAQSVRPQNLITAREFIRVTYPELASTGAAAQFRLDSWLTGPLSMAMFSMRLNNPRNDVDFNDPSALLLDASFKFDDNGRIEKYFASGRILHDDQNNKLAKDVESHEMWSDTIILRELTRRGARFGPDNKEQMLSRVKVLIRELEPMLGELSVISIEFEMPETERHGLSVIGVLCWVVRYQSSSGLQGELTFEPFGGNLVAVMSASRR